MKSQISSTKFQINLSAGGSIFNDQNIHQNSRAPLSKIWRTGGRVLIAPFVGLFVYTSNRIEILAEQLARIIRTPLPTQLTPENIVVQSRGIDFSFQKIAVQVFRPIFAYSRDIKL